MHDAQRRAVTANQAVQMHQTGHIPGGDHLGAGVQVVEDAVATHQTGDRFFRHGERASETAAFVRTLQFDQLQPLNQRKKLPGVTEARLISLRGAPQPQFAQSMTAVMQSNAKRERNSLQPVEPNNFHKKLSQLKRFRPQLLKPWAAGEKVLIMLRDHRHAAARRADDRIKSREDAEKPVGKRSGLLPATGVGHWLPAAGLVFRKFDAAPAAFEQLQRREGNLRRELIDVTGNKQADFHGGWQLRMRGAEGFRGSTGRDSRLHSLREFLHRGTIIQPGQLTMERRTHQNEAG